MEVQRLNVDFVRECFVSSLQDFDDQQEMVSTSTPSPTVSDQNGM